MNRRWLDWSAVTAAVVVVGLAGCSVGRPIETPTGPTAGDIFGRLEILGMGERTASSGNQPAATSVFVEEFSINVPVRTEAVFVAIHGWAFVFGSQVPEHGCQGGSFTAHPGQRPLGFELANVRVIDVNAPDMSVTPPRQTARLRVQMLLQDTNADDPWTGCINYSLLFLGRSPR